MIQQLESIIWDMEYEKRGLFVNWLKRHNKYLMNEVYFKPTLSYKRGMVIHVDFGFRVGAEYRGFHWAAVIENTAKSSETAVVVPLSSVKEGDKVHPKDAYLGKIQKLNNNDAEALIGQITAVSKLRIKNGPMYKLSYEQLNEIDNKVIERYVGPEYRKKLL